MFHKASVRLTALYLLIIMAISLFFSVSLYQLSVQEFDRGFRGPGRGAVLDRAGPQQGPLSANDRAELTVERENQFQEARSRVLRRLILTNLLILAGGGVLSYYLAKRTLEPIEEAQEAQNRFTADASHELRTPIAAMQSEIEVALMNPKLTVAQAKKQLTSNLEELARLTNLSEGLLQLATNDRKAMNKEQFLLEDLVGDAISRVLPLSEKKGTLIIPPALLTGRLQGDRSSLTEALVILLDNAIKYSPDKTEIHVTSTIQGKSVLVSVIDKGIGIKASEIPHLFERFYRADSSRSKQEIGGYGLGLSIAKNIVDSHQGDISVASKPGQGTRFTVTLPLLER